MKEPTFNLIEECKDAKKIIVTGHIKPDGDCIGASIALTMYLRKRLPDAEIHLMLEKPAPCFAYLTGIELIETDYSGKPEDTDICIVVDTNSGRIGNAQKYYDVAKKTINIDHHISNENGCADLNYVDPKASSASELIYRMMDKEFLDDETAKFIYLGITHDTGVFRFNSTSKDTMNIAAELITYNFDFSDLLEKTYYEKTFEQMKTISEIVANCERYCDGKVVYGFVTYEDFVKKNMNPNDFDGAINELRIIQGCECAVFMYPMNEVTIKVSLRSTGSVDVSKISETFGGGGHKRAAGFYQKAEREALFKDILGKIKEQTGWQD